MKPFRSPQDLPPRSPAADGLLVLDSVSAGYGPFPVLRDVSIIVPKGALVALLGANGAGKTTLLRVASGLLRPSSGTVSLDGQDLTGLPPFRRAAAGMCLVPEGRGIFPSLTVRDNLELQVPPWLKDGKADSVLEIFPALGSRMAQVAGSLSGGEQQMLALARAVLAQPKVILLDEISLGLAPQLVDRLFEVLSRLAAMGTAMLVVEQYVSRALELCSHSYIMNKGTVVYEGPSSDLKRSAVIDSYMGA
jgi:branched-chain amino acid transport system ATP-binding protein